MGSTEDDRLLEAIARDRDREAFGQLYERHERSAYNLARYILRNTDDAEDAVQEGFSQVWASADTFRAGNPRSWILRIVARKCFRLLRKSPSKESEADMTNTVQTAPNQAPEELVEHGELNSALHFGLERLSTDDRQIVALHYGAGLSQDDVASTLAMPQTTVSYRLKSILSRLRADLTQAGFAGVTVGVTSEAIGEAVCARHVAPDTLATRVMKTAFTRETVAASRRAVAAPSQSARLFPWFVGAVILVVAGVSVWIMSNQAPASQGSKEIGPADAVTPDLQAEKPPVVLPIKWTFEKGSPANLKAAFGTWMWDGRKPEMRVDASVYLPFPAGLPREPMVLIVRGRPLKSGSSSAVTTYCVKDGRIGPRSAFVPAKRPEVVVDPRREFEFRVYMWERRRATAANGKLMHVLEHEQDQAADAHYFGLEQMTVRSIELRIAALDEIPSHARAADLRKSGHFASQRWPGYAWEEPKKGAGLLP